jgi:nucleoside-diphosphate-sugar epimerase
MTSGLQQRDWVHVSDVVAGLLAGVESEGLQAGDSYDIGTGKPTSVADVVRQIYAIIAGKGKPLIGVLPNRSGEANSQIANIAATDQLLNWRPAIALEEGLLQI